MAPTWNRIKPSLGRVAVELMKQDEMTASGKLYLPDTARDVAANCGRVVAICDDYEYDGEKGPIYRLDDIVVFGKYTGSSLEVAGRKCVVLREDDILCTLHTEIEDAGRDGRDGGSPAGVTPIGRVRASGADRIPFLGGDTLPSGDAKRE